MFDSVSIQIDLFERAPAHEDSNAVSSTEVYQGPLARSLSSSFEGLYLALLKLIGGNFMEFH